MHSYGAIEAAAGGSACAIAERGMHKKPDSAGVIQWWQSAIEGGLWSVGAYGGSGSGDLF